MSYETPCSEGNSDDWFIGRDGKQYTDEDLVSDDDVAAHLNKFDPNGTRSVDEIERVWDRLEADAKREALQRRRQAREKCYECYFRTNCLTQALDEDQHHGTWGGYYEEQIRELRKEISRRRKKRVADPRPLDE